MKKKILVGILIGFILILVLVLYELQIIPHRTYTNEDFHISSYISPVDKDEDGIDDQTDVLRSVKKYLETKPKYKSKYYGTGYPDDEYGVCTDVVAFGLKGAGYDLRELVYEDVLNHRDRYSIDVVDKNIDFRRVQNLDVYFKNNHLSLTTDYSNIEEWQGGDIVVFPNHIGILSDKRNRRGIPYLIHHAYPMQLHYEEDVIERYGKDAILGHYRIS